MVEAIKTEKYDYSENADQREQIITELYELPTEQLFKVRSFARKLGGWTPLRTGFVCISHTA